MKRLIATATALIVLAAAAPAVAAPGLGVQLTRDAAIVGTNDERLDYSAKVTNTAPAGAGNQTSGLIALEVELPAGDVYAFSAAGTGWGCETIPPFGPEPAKAICNRSDSLAPGASYPNVTVVTALGPEIPEPALARATVGGGGAAATATAADELTFTPNPFGLTLLDTALLDEAGDDYTQAGGHPFSGIGDFAWATKRALSGATGGIRKPVEDVKQVFTDLPRGLVGNALAVPQLCPHEGGCPAGSIVGQVRTLTRTAPSVSPIWAVEPEFGKPAQFRFQETFSGNVFTISARLRPEDNYAISLDLAPAPIVEVMDATVTICGYGGRLKGLGSSEVNCKKAGDIDANPKPLFSVPTRCEGEAVVRVRLNSWENPTHFATAEATDPEAENCELVPFEPTMELEPTSTQADSPTGLNVDLTMPTEGLESKTGISQANLKRARITFPQGMAVNASAGHGLGSCSAQQVKLKTNDPISCPDSSKIGTIEIDTPLIQETLKGATYIARQGDVDGALIGLYLVFESKKDGIIVKLPAKVELDPITGQLVTIVDQSPEAPFSAVRMRFPGGPEATLLTPPRCGTYEIEAELSSWAAADPDSPTKEEIVTDTSSFEVTEGPNGAPCPTGALEPRFNAGATDPSAGETSPFVMRLSREDGSQRFSGLALAPPLGLTAYLKGVSYCPDAALASISAAPESGQSQIANPSCPASSQIGTVVAGAGGGANPLYVDTGKAYLAGPYKGAPISIVTVVPAVAGPLDLGSVVVRNAVHVDPVNAQIRVISDPIPTILHGILLDVRDIRVSIDRPDFTLNPTDCSEKQIAATIKGAKGLSANEPGDSAEVSNRFQADGCANLAFKPRVNLRLFGGTTRAKYQGVRAIVRPRPGDANISGAVVKFPTSAFVAQEHLNNICTRVQWAADNCPKGSIYGTAEAITPLLDQPLKGNVHLRSSSNLLPDLVADLRGPAHQPIKVEVAIKNDAVKGALRNTVMTAPDAPVTYFRLQTFGGSKGLIVNSRNICKGSNNARASFSAHNGRRSVQVVPVRNARCAKQRKAAKRKQMAKKRSAAARRTAHGA